MLLNIIILIAMRRRCILSMMMLLLSLGLLSQIPQGFNYQAVARDASGDEITRTDLFVRIAILSGITPEIIIWEEEHSVTTNDFGLMSLTVGDPAAKPVAGSVKNFGEINWLINPIYIKTRIYYQSTWFDMDPSQLVSVPYSMVAEQALSVAGNPLMMNGDTVYFLNNVAVGTDSPGKAKLAVVGDDPLSEDALFEVRRIDGEVVFAVYNQGVRVNVPTDPLAKGPKGGFAIGGFDAVKGVVQDYFVVNNDSIRVYIDTNPAGKGPKGGFAIGGFGAAKAPGEEYLRVTRDSTRVYVTNPAKGPKGGFAIGGFDGTKGITESFLNLTRDNYFIGYHAGYNNSAGINNAFIGTESGYNNANGYNNVLIGSRSGYYNTGYNNIFIGSQAGENSSSTTNTTFIGNMAGFNLIGDDNIAIGDAAGYNMYMAENECFGMVILGIDAGRNVAGSYNTLLGYSAGSKWGSAGTGEYNVFVGSSAGAGGANKLTDGNVCIGYRAGYDKNGSNKLYIANNSTTTLLYGEFDNEYLLLTGDMDITGDLDVAGAYSKSDERYKTDISELKGSIQALSNINSVYFDWDADEFPDKRFSTGRQIGFLAQEVEPFFPEIVKTDKNGYKSLDYSKMTVVLLQAVKEQQKIIESDNREIGRLQSEIQSLQERLSQIEALLMQQK